MMIQNSVVWLIATALGIGVLYSASTVLLPVFIAFLFAYASKSLLEKLMHAGLSRDIAAMLTTLLVVVVLLLSVAVIVPLLYREVSLLLNLIPAQLDFMMGKISPWILQTFGTTLTFDTATLQRLLSKNWQKVGEITQHTLQFLSAYSSGLIIVILSCLLVPVFLFYLLRDWSKLMTLIQGAIPQPYQQTVQSIALEIDGVLGAYWRGQVMVVAVLTLCYVSGLWLVGLQLAVPVALVAGLLSFVPQLGTMVGFLLAVMAAFLQFGSVSGVMPVLLVFGFTQILEGFFLTPKLVGDRIGLHPAMTILVLLLGANWFGFFGVLLAIPVSASLVIIVRRLKQHLHQPVLE